MNTAIYTDPQRSAILLAIPFRAVTRVARPVLAALNGAANAALRLFKVTPVDELAQAHGPPGATASAPPSSPRSSAIEPAGGERP